MAPTSNPIRQIFGRQKALEGWLGNPALNRLGLHNARIALTDGCVRSRRATLRSRIDRTHRETFLRDGVLAIPDFFDATTYEAVRTEVNARLAAVEETAPIPTHTDERGFGEKRSFPGGFDRFDGGTLNRFVEIDDASTPRTHTALRDERLAAICEFASGYRFRPERFEIYEIVHGDEADNPDLQKDIHRDTFHTAVKAWLFLEEVTLEDGPFAYVIGSHHANRERHRWERQHALDAIEGRGAGRGGSFRIAEEDLPALGLPAPTPFPVKGNTLVIADVFGFHRRSVGIPGSRRISLYANLRGWPFAPVAY